MLKIFAHRGFVGNQDLQNYTQQNSLASLKNAFDSGFRAIEFDIWFCNSQLILSHDQPQLDDYKNLAHFSEFLTYGNELDYWLDFKNLDESNIDKVLELVKSQIDAAKINLEKFFFAPYCIDYDLSKKLFDKFFNVFGSRISMVAIADNHQQISQLFDFVKNAETEAHGSMVTDAPFLQNICPSFFHNLIIYGIITTIHEKFGAKKYTQLW